MTLATDLAAAQTAVNSVSDAPTKAALNAVLVAANDIAAILGQFNMVAAKGSAGRLAAVPAETTAGGASFNPLTDPVVPGRVTSAAGSIYTLVDISTASLPGATHAVAYSQQLAATGGKSAYTWSAVSLPTGLSLSSSGLLSGTIAAAGAQNVIVTVTDSLGDSVSKLFSLAVA